METIQVKIFRFDPAIDTDHHYRTYEVPFEKGLSVMNVLDYVYQNIDGSLAYYDHAGCDLGICGRCLGKVNGKTVLMCQAPVTDDLLTEPVNKEKVLSDLVVDR